MSKKVVAAVRTGAHETEFREYPMPEIPDDGALVKMEVAGICGTDVKFYAKPPIDDPVIMGHENIGYIDKAGKQFQARKKVKEGDLVFIEHYVPCFACLMWPEGEEPKRYDWNAGAMITPPNMWFHQHFNTGDAPARYLAFKYEGVAIRNSQGVPKAWISRRIGGHQIDYADESEVVRTLFAEALAEHGRESQMEDPYEQEKESLPPLPEARQI